MFDKTSLADLLKERKKGKDIEREREKGTTNRNYI